MLRKLINRLVPSSHAPAQEIRVSVSGTEEADRLIARGDRAEAEGNLREACEQYRKAVTAAPGYAKARLNLGVALEALGDTEGALQCYEAALAIEPENVYVSYNLGKLLYTRGALSRAEDLLRTAVTHKPEFPEAHVVLSTVYEAEGNFVAAAAALEAALALRPDWPGPLLDYGMGLRKLERLTEAEAVFRRVTAIDPENARASYEFGTLLHARGALPEAEKLLRLALEREPGSQETHRALFYVYESQGNVNAAAATLERALEQWPDWDDALLHYGATLKKLQRLSEAEAALRRAIAIAPENSRAYRVLGTVLLPQSRVADSLESFAKARQLDPDSFGLESAELFTLNLYNDISIDALFARHKAFGIRIEKSFTLRFVPFQNVKEPERKLRIGYVSGDFNSNPVSVFMIPLLERHDRTAYEIHCYSVGTTVDEFTNQVRSQQVIWREVASMSYTDMADTINRDGIDVLIDLSGHSRESRLAVFAQQPAPVQVTWLGYLNSTGMTRIQYRLCDRYTDPPGMADQYHTESLYRLPNSQWCYRPRVSIDYTCSGMPPFRKNGYITFGSFNDTPKLSPSVRKLWRDILLALPDSRLVFVGVAAGYARDSLIQYFEHAGIARTRITVVARVPFQEYFRWFDAVDIALDTTPYSGGTTTCDSLWMGVPVITVPGTRPVSRSTASILSSVGLTEWIASTPEDYVRLAVHFAGESALLPELRGTLRQRMQESPLMDEVRFARDIEDAYRTMWQAWCSGTHV